VGGSRIIDRVANVLRIHCDRLLVAPGSRDAADWLPDAAIAPDLLPVKASITGIHAAITAARTDVIAIAWDMPFVPTEFVGELARQLVQGASAVVPVVGGRLQPLCAAYSQSAAPALSDAVQRGVLSNSEMLIGLRGVMWLEEKAIRAFGDPAVMFFNVNTGEDLNRAEEIAKSL
jgi:molybdopterin-guanine dinucleotide biosynthesis protein A